jgi:DNA-binding PadR family transcriptional regulator
MHRAARGNVRAAILALLAEQKASGGPAIHGYQIIQELSTRTGGAWRPSPGSIYPTLQLLEDEGLIASQAPEGKRLFELTDAGQAEFDRTKGTKAPWEQVSDGFGESRIQLKVAARDTLIQLVWVARNGTDEQRAEVLTLLGEFQERLSALVPEAAAELAHDHGHGRGHVRRRTVKASDLPRQTTSRCDRFADFLQHSRDAERLTYRETFDRRGHRGSARWRSFDTGRARLGELSAQCRSMPRDRADMCDRH